MREDTNVNWEEILDRELADLVAAGRLSMKPSGFAGAKDLLANGSGSDEAGRLLGIEQFRAAVLESIRSDRALSLDVCNEAGVVLLPAGSRMTGKFLDEIRARGMTRVRLRSPKFRESHGGGEAGNIVKVEDLHSKESRLLDERLAGELQRPVNYQPVKAWRRPRLSLDDLKTEARIGVEKHSATSAAVADLCGKLKPGSRTSANELRNSVEQFVGMASVDFDLLPLVVAMQHSDDEYLYDHCVNVALLSMAIASHLGLERDQIATIGLGGMLQDIGMLRVPVSIRLEPGELTDREWHEIHRHPLHTLDMLADVRDLPQTVRFIGYQAHERFDGCGYPRGRFGPQLHEYAKIVSVADVYVAMTSKRPYRPAIQPYEAARTVLMEAAKDKFDRTLVRALLDTVSLFPIGSEVHLSDGSAARVLRANPGMHTRPVVETIGVDGSPTGYVVDLATEDAPRVVKAG